MFNAERKQSKLVSIQNITRGHLQNITRGHLQRITRGHLQKITRLNGNTGHMYNVVTAFRGIQYVYCVMHKCIMFKVGGNEKHKVCKKHVNFTNLGGNLEKQRGKEKFPRNRGNVLKQQKYGGNSKFVVNENFPQSPKKI